MSLYSSSDINRWRTACCQYNEALRAGSQKKAELHALACWTYCELPVAILGRSPPHLTQPELSKLMAFKLSIGKWRPGLQKYVDELSPAAVKDASLRAFAFAGAGKVRESIEALTVLKGVGPATATLILSAYSPQFPFMSDEALEEVVGSRQYTLDEALELTKKCRDKAQQLNSLEHAGGGSAEGSVGGSSSAGAGGGQPLQPKVTPAQVQAGRTIDTASVRPAATGSTGNDLTAPAHAHLGSWTANRVQMAVVGAVRAGKGMAGSSASASSSPCASCTSPSAAAGSGAPGLAGTGAVAGGNMPAHAGCLGMPCGGNTSTGSSGKAGTPTASAAAGGKRKGAANGETEGEALVSPSKRGKSATTSGQGMGHSQPGAARGARNAK